MGLVDKLFGSYSAKELKRIRPQVDAVLALEDHYRQMDNKTLQGETARFKELLANGKTLDDILPEAFAACREAARTPSLSASTIAFAERYASFPGRSMQTLPLLRQSAAASEVTFGRLS